MGGTGRQNGAVIDSNHVVSPHGKGNAITKLLSDALKKENAGKTGVCCIKTEAQDLCARAGLQLPGSAAQDGLIHSIFDAGSPVNRKKVLPRHCKLMRKNEGLLLQNIFCNRCRNPKVMLITDFPRTEDAREW